MKHSIWCFKIQNKDLPSNDKFHPFFLIVNEKNQSILKLAFKRKSQLLHSSHTPKNLSQKSDNKSTASMLEIIILEN